MSKPLTYILGTGALLTCLLLCSKPLFRQYVNTDTYANKIGCRLFEFNALSVAVDDALDLHKVEIRTNQETVFQRGQQQNRMGQSYGHRILEVYYSDQLIAELGHFSLNNWHTYRYALNIAKSKDGFTLRPRIQGPNVQRAQFQKRYVYDARNNLVRIDYLDAGGKVYDAEDRPVVNMGNLNH